MSSDQDNFHAPGPATWSGRFSEPVDERVKRFTASVGFDRRLAEQDIAGSLAHARMLGAAGVLSAADVDAIERGMATILEEIRSGRFEWSLDAEDVHLNVERRLTALAGDAGKRLHTGRSRNDQVATDIRLFVREAIDRIVGLIRDVQRALVGQAERHAATVMPGFTHLQVAQPVTFGHHMLAYHEMFERDAGRFTDCRRRANRLPLGAAALAGTTYPIDRERVARDLGFDGVCENSLDAVSDRDFAIELCAAASVTMMHLSRLCEEIIVWMNPRFGFVRLPDRFCTGSSIMPQKKNPDVPELTRGKTGRVYGHLVGLLTLMKGQPLAYNKDNQEDKEPLFDTIDTVVDSLAIFAELIAGIEVDAERMRAALGEGHATATDLADYLVKRGRSLPRRARGGGACGARGRGTTLRSRGAAARGTPHVRAADRPGRFRRARPGGLGGGATTSAARPRRRCSRRWRGRRRGSRAASGAFEDRLPLRSARAGSRPDRPARARPARAIGTRRGSTPPAR